MKKLFIIAVSAVLAFTACGGSDPSGVTDQSGDLFISVDKTVVESDGKDIAVFTIKDASGKVITTEANAGSVFFKNVADGSRLPRYSTGFTSIVDGEFEFVGLFNGVETANSVKIKSQNRANYEVYHRNVAIFKLTGTWCSNCPRMTTALHSLGEDAADHSVVLACHNEDNGHPFYVDYKGRDLASAVFIQMGASSSSYPTNCYDLVEMDSASSTITIADIVMNRRIEAPASVGIKISSVELEGTTLKVRATVKASAAGSYDATCALVADDLEYKGGYTDNDKDLYSNVVIGVSGENFLSYSAASGFELSKDQEYERTFEFEFGSAPSSALLSKMRAAVLVHKKSGNSSEINNCAECAYGKTLDYRYN